MAMAFVAAMRSKDPRTKVGACIVNPAKRIVGVGYNGAPNGYRDKVFPWKKPKTPKLESKSFYGKKSSQSVSYSSEISYQFFIMKKINTAIKLRNFVIALT
jgi:hypothetical protein